MSNSVIWVLGRISFWIGLITLMEFVFNDMDIWWLLILGIILVLISVPFSKESIKNREEKRRNKWMKKFIDKHNNKIKEIENEHINS